jgi:DNA-binding NtrC family response regulator
MAKELGRRFLLVERNLFVAKTTASFLKDGNHEMAYHASNLPEARDAIEGIEIYNFNTVLVGAMKSGDIGDGILVARAMRDRDPSVPTVLYTNQHDVPQREFTRVVSVGSDRGMYELATTITRLPDLSRH